MASRYDGDILSPIEAARMLRMGQNTVKEALKRGDFPFGFAVRGKGRNGRARYTYIISRKAVEAFLAGDAR